jgi:hypothetical protein
VLPVRDGDKAGMPVDRFGEQRDQPPLVAPAQPVVLDYGLARREVVAGFAGADGEGVDRQQRDLEPVGPVVAAGLEVGGCDEVLGVTRGEGTAFSSMPRKRRRDG